MNSKPLQSYGDWQLVKTLGEGAFGEVHLWRHFRTGEEFATKRLKANPKLKPDEISIMHKRWYQEYNWMQNLETQYIVRAVQINDTEFFKYLAGENHVEQSLPIIIMEYCNGGDLRSQLNQVENFNGLQEFEIRKILFSLLCAIEYLHERLNIEHRDIKPENIVLHNVGNEKIYKLTDLGYAREIPDNTIQSVVGTRNYVAPEVVDPGHYTKTVDYWCIGIVAYEIICGQQPFLPHQTFFNRMSSIKQKPRNCIAITQDVNSPTTEKFIFNNHLPTQNHSSPIFIKAMEKWLTLALDTDYKTRGYDSMNEPKFYTVLHMQLERKIVAVFSLKTYEKFYYDVNAYTSLQDFLQKISNDTKIDLGNIFIIYPPLHPSKNSQNPAEYFVPEWSDTSNPLNPPVMLFVGEFLIQSELKVDFAKHINISDAITTCMNMSAQLDNLPIWLVQQFERDVHFVLAKEQHYLDCYLMGIQNYVIEIEDFVFNYKYEIDKLSKKSSELIGSVKHSNILLNELKNIQNGQIANSANDMTRMFNMECKDFETNIVPTLSRIYNDLLQTFRELASNKMYKEVTEEDIFELSAYRRSLRYEYPLEKRLENAQCAFDKCMQKFNTFITSAIWKETRATINNKLQMFNNLQQEVKNVFEKMIRLEEELYNYTRSLLRYAINNNFHLSSSMITVDGTNAYNTLNAFDSETPELLNETQSIINAMESAMNIDE